MVWKVPKVHSKPFKPLQYLDNRDHNIARLEGILIGCSAAQPLSCHKFGPMRRYLTCRLIGASFALPRLRRRSGRRIGEGRSALRTAARTMVGEGGGRHRSPVFWPPKPERANRDKFRKPSGMACPRLPNTVFSGDCCRFGISAWYDMTKIFDGDNADRAWVSGLIRQGFARLGLESDQQSDRDHIRKFRAGVPDRSIGVRSVQCRTTKFHISRWFLAD